MIKCEYCNSNVDESLGTCPHCGAPLPTVDTTTANTESTASDNTTESDSEDTTEETVLTTGGILSGLASALLRPKKRPYIQEARPVPPPMPGRERPMPPENHRNSGHDRHGGGPHNQGRGPHR